MLICGIDEAGRGPIIGPMVMAGALFSEEDEKKLKAMGVKDSKLLLPKERERLFDDIREIAKDSVILIIGPEEIDDAVQGKEGLNLNRLEAKKTAEILNALKPNVAYVDCPSNNTSAYNRLLGSQLTFKPKKLITEHKADTRYVAVGAASILAKVTRDREIEKIKEKIGKDFGSGYLSDQKTVAFFDKHHHDYPHLFRKSWAPYQQKLNSKFQSTLEQFSASVSSPQNAEIIEKLKKLESLGYVPAPVSSAHEQFRMKGECTVTLYTNGKILVQGEGRERIEKILGL